MSITTQKLTVLTYTGTDDIFVEKVEVSELSECFAKLKRTESYVQKTLEYIQLYGERNIQYPYTNYIVYYNGKPIILFFEYQAQSLGIAALFLSAHTCLDTSLFDHLDAKLGLKQKRANEFLLINHDNCWYERDYLPEGLVINANDLDGHTSLMSYRLGYPKQNLSRLPDNLTIKGTVNISSPVEKIPNNLRVEGSLYLSEMQCKEVGTNLVVTEELVLSDTPIVHPLSCQTLTLKERTIDMDLSLVKGLVNINVDHSKVPSNITIPGHCLISNEIEPEQELSRITANTVSIVAFKITKLSEIQWDKLKLINLEDLVSITAIQVNSLHLDDCPTLHSIDRLVLSRDLVVNRCHRIRLPDYGIVYGNMHFKKTIIPIPLTFGCFGEISFE